MTIPNFPDLAGVAFPTKKTPIWSTLKHRNVSGKVSALQQWTAPCYKYELPFSVLRSDSVNTEWQTLIGFYNRVGGAAQPFFFTDPDDGSISGQEIGTGNAVNTTFQLVRALGGFVEPIFSPTVMAVTVGGVAQTEGVDFTEDNGLLTFVVAPGIGVAVAWTGTYDWLCRFDDDSIDFAKFAYQFWELRQITFTTEKL